MLVNCLLRLEQVFRSHRRGGKRRRNRLAAKGFQGETGERDLDKRQFSNFASERLPDRDVERDRLIIVGKKF